MSRADKYMTVFNHNLSIDVHSYIYIYIYIYIYSSSLSLLKTEATTTFGFFFVVLPDELCLARRKRITIKLVERHDFQLTFIFSSFSIELGFKFKSFSFTPFNCAMSRPIRRAN